MTLEDIKHMDADFLKCSEVASCLKCNPSSLHSHAQDDPDKLGFPTIVMGNRVLFPRVAFIRYCMGECTSEQQ